MERCNHLQAFTSNPFFSLYVAELQEAADQATQSICGGFVGERDMCAILEREQTIGAATAYLRFSQLVLSDQSELIQQLQKQQ